MFKVGQKVWCLIYGQGVVTEVVDDYIDEDRIEDTYSVFVKFQNHDDHLSISYTTDGRYLLEGNVTLFPYPVEIVKSVTKPSIDWSHVSPEYNYLAQDSNGQGYLCGKKPQRMDYAWDMGPSPYIRATTFTSYEPGGCDWKDSLVKRPIKPTKGSLALPFPPLRRLK